MTSNNVVFILFADKSYEITVYHQIIVTIVYTRIKIPPFLNTVSVTSQFIKILNLLRQIMAIN